MKYAEMYKSLTLLFSPLGIKVLLILAERPHTRSELYAACSAWNNTTVKSVTTVWENRGLVVGGATRGDPYRLTLKGKAVTEWLMEGALSI